MLIICVPGVFFRTLCRSYFNEIKKTAFYDKKLQMAARTMGVVSSLLSGEEGVFGPRLRHGMAGSERNTLLNLNKFDGWGGGGRTNMRIGGLDEPIMLSLFACI